MFMDRNGAFSLRKVRKEDKYVFWELTYELWIDYGLYKENIKFRSLLNWGWKIIFTRFVNEIWEVQWLKNSENWAKQVQVLPFWTNMCSPWPHTFIIHFNMYQMCLSSQFSVLNAVLNKTAPLLALTLYYKLISSILEINLLLIIMKAF